MKDFHCLACYIFLHKVDKTTLFFPFYLIFCPGISGNFWILLFLRFWPGPPETVFFPEFPPKWLVYFFTIPLRPKKEKRPRISS